MTLNTEKSKGSSLSTPELIFALLPRFQRYGPIFKIAIFGNETWLLGKVPEVPHILYFILPQWVEIEVIFVLRAAVSEIWIHFSKLQYLSMKRGHWPKCQKLHIYPLSTPGESKLRLNLLYGQRFQRYGDDFQNCHIWA